MRSGGGEGCGELFGQVAYVVRTGSRDTESGGECDPVQGGLAEVGERPRLRTQVVVAVPPQLGAQHVVDVVGRDQDDDVAAFAGHAPQCLRCVEGASVRLQGDDRAVRRRDRGAEGDGEPWPIAPPVLVSEVCAAAPADAVKNGYPQVPPSTETIAPAGSRAATVAPTVEPVEAGRGVRQHGAPVRPDVVALQTAARSASAARCPRPSS